MSTYSVDHRQREGGMGWKVLAVFAGFLVPIVMIIGLWLAISAHNASNSAAKAAAGVPSAPTTTAPGVGAVATPSYAGIAPADAADIAMKHTAFPATLPAAPAGPVAHINLAMADRVVTIAPGISYHAWTFGQTAPGPVIHVRVGQRVDVTLTNNGTMPHSLDFHAAEIAPNLAFSDIMPGESKKFSWVARVPGAYMYHCGTAPAFEHIANGMYGAIIVEPKNMPPAQKEYVLVSSEWYLDAPGDSAPANLDLTKAEHMTPDWVTFNGYAAQYKTHPLTSNVGDTVRFWVVDGGPSLNTEFHVVGTVLQRAWINADMIDVPQHGIQTALVPAGGGGVFDVTIKQPGIYPFVSHSFASVMLGEVGLLNVGNVGGTMSH